MGRLHLRTVASALYASHGVKYNPYNPKLIRVDTKMFSIRQMDDLIERGDVDLSPDFQRGFVWNDITRKSRLIESLLLRIPIPIINFSISLFSYSIILYLLRILGFSTYVLPLQAKPYLSTLVAYDTIVESIDEIRHHFLDAVFETKMNQLINIEDGITL